MIRCECPRCAQILELGDEYAGLVTACVHCGELLTVPIPAPTPPPIPTQAAAPAPPPLPRIRPYTPNAPELEPVAGPPQTSGLAVASLSFGIASFLCLGPLCSVPGVITGHMALSQFKNTPRAYKGQGMATTGLIMSYINLAIIALIILGSIPAAILLPAMTRAREAARRASCQNNLKQMGIIFKMSSAESKGLFPELNPHYGPLTLANAAPGLESIFPEYLTDLQVLRCPSDAEADALPAEAGQTDPQSAFDRSSYTYLGYVVTNEAELNAFVQAYKDRLAQGLRFDTDLDVSPGTGSGGGDKIRRLREGVERNVLRDPGDPAAAAAAQASIPVLWDNVRLQQGGAIQFNHIPGGSNVLFMDGHVEFIKYPGKFPLTKEAVRLLSELEAMK